MTEAIVAREETTVDLLRAYGYRIHALALKFAKTLPPKMFTGTRRHTMKLPVQADMVLIVKLQRCFGYTTAYVYTLISTLALRDQYQGKPACKLDCGVWRDLDIEDDTWYWTLKNWP